MSRANPIGLRLASKKLNPSFIGVGQYYSYSQFKYNIVIHKSIKQLSKQLAVPAYQVANRFDSEKRNTKNQVLYPSILPINHRLKAKQLFDSHYVLNRRRFYSVAIYITRLLKEQFEKNYNNFLNSHGSDDIKRKSFALNLPVAGPNRYQKWKSKKYKFSCLCPSVTFAREFFRISQKLSHHGDKRGLSIKNQKIYKREKKEKLFEQTKQSKTLDFLFPIIDSDPYLILSYGVFAFGNKPKARKIWQKLKRFYFFTKKINVSINGLNSNSLTPLPLVKNKSNACISLLALSRTSAVFTLKKLKGRHSRTNSQIIPKTTHLASRFSADKNKNVNVKDELTIYSKKYKSYNNLPSAKTVFHFFQYLSDIKQNNSTNASSLLSCPEWPLSTNFSPIRASLTESKNLQNKSSNSPCWEKHLSFIVIKRGNALKVKEQKEPTYFKTKKKDQACPRNFGIAFFKNQSQNWNWSLKEIYNKPVVSYQIIKRFILLSYLTTTLPVYSTLYQKPPVNGESTIAVSFPMAKEVENKQKRLHINLASMNKGEVLKTLSANRISYTFCPATTNAILNLKNIKKLTKQIKHFRSDIKLLAPLEHVLHRSFSEPVGIHCISALDNRLKKTYCNQFLKNLLFARTSNNFLKSNYMDSQIELLREKNNILFDFAYTKNSLIQLGLKKTNTVMQQLLETGHTKLWLRKLSSIRL